MAGKTITLTRNARIKGKRYTAGDKAQVDSATLAELEAAGAVAQPEATPEPEAENKPAKGKREDG